MADIMSIKTGAEPAGRLSAGRLGFAFMVNADIARRSLPILAAVLLASTMLLPMAARAAPIAPEPRDGFHRPIDRKAQLQEAKRLLLAQSSGGNGGNG